MKYKLNIQVTFLIIFSVFSVNCSESSDNCKRKCVSGTLPKKCKYDFYVRENSVKTYVCNNNDDHCDYKFNPGYVINGQSSGPSIEVCLGDVVQVTVHNRLKTEEIALHWNGIYHNLTVHMDGVPMVTQCPILPFASFRYDLRPTKSGTFFYHAHSALQQADGLYGALIVRAPEEDSAFEEILMISAKTSRPLHSLENVDIPEAVGILINGQETYADIKVSPDGKYRFRLINANAMDCPVKFSIADHDIKIISVDSNPVVPLLGKRVILFPGERVDFEVKTLKEPGRYGLVISGLHDCKNLHIESALIYDNHGSYDETIKASEHYLELPEVIQGQRCEELGKGTICSMDTESLNDEKLDEIPDDTIFIPFDQVFYNLNDDITDYRFNIYEFTYYPAYLSVKSEGTKIAQINGMTFKYPTSPLLSQPEELSEEIVCSIDYKSKECHSRPLFCECLQILELPAMKNIDIVLINEGKGGNNSYVFHLHGYSARVLSSGEFDKPVSKNDIISLYANGRLDRNLVNPPKKDTIVVPNKGYAVLRIFTDNLGYWLWESRSTGLSPGITGPGMQFLMQVGWRESLPTVPINFPTCGNHKGPDLIFEEE